MQFQRQPRGDKGYPHLPSHWPDLNGDGNVYVSGYGFVHLNPQDIERHEIRRSASIAGGVMLMLLLLPTVLMLPAQLVVRQLGAFLTLQSTDDLVLWTAILEELRTGLWTVGTYLIPIFFLIGIGEREIRQQESTAFSLQTAFLGLLCALGVSSVLMAGGEVLGDILQEMNLLVVRDGETLPTATAAVILFLIRLAMTVLLQEVLLRGLLLRFFRKHGDAFALMMSSVVSGLIAGTLTGDLSQFAMALVYGYLLLRTGSLLVPVLGHLLCAFWPVVLQLLVPGRYLGSARSMTALVLIMLGLIAFALFCRQDPNAFILSQRSLDYGKLSGRLESGCKSLFPFRRKLGISLTSAFFSASAALWLFQAGQNMLVL